MREEELGERVEDDLRWKGTKAVLKRLTAHRCKLRRDRWMGSERELACRWRRSRVIRGEEVGCCVMAACSSPAGAVLFVLLI